MDVKISIIVPVYKAEAYIARCVNSILNQTFQQWELILIDDGSPDRSGVLCDQFALKDSRIRVFHKENGGVASAREMGMQNARGIYSIHVDPDDWIDSDMLYQLFEKAVSDDADMVVCDFLIEYSDRSLVDLQAPVEMNSSSFLLQLTSMERHGSLCNKLIRTRLYKDLNLHFPVNMDCWEDLYICVCILHSKCKLSYLNKAFYHYDFSSNENSLVRNTSSKGLNAQQLCIRLLENRLGEAACSFYTMKSMVLLTAYRLNLMDENQIRNLYPEINDWYINRYRKDWEHVYYYGLALVLSGRSIRYANFIKAMLGMMIRLLRVVNCFRNE